MLSKEYIKILLLFIIHLLITSTYPFFISIICFYFK